MLAAVIVGVLMVVVLPTFFFTFAVTLAVPSISLRSQPGSSVAPTAAVRSRRFSS